MVGSGELWQGLLTGDRVRGLGISGECVSCAVASGQWRMQWCHEGTLRRVWEDKFRGSLGYRAGAMPGGDIQGGGGSVQPHCVLHNKEHTPRCLLGPVSHSGKFINSRR